MKILVTFYSQSGNTEKIANAIYSELKDEDATIQSTKDVDVSTLSSNDLIFIGSPVHAGGFPKPIKEFLKTLPENASTKIASFYTYGVPIPSFYDKFGKKVGKQVMKRGLNLVGEFCCLGEHRALNLLEKVSPEAAEKAKVESKGHPDEKDIEAAKQFAKEIKSKC